LSFARVRRTPKSTLFPYTTLFRSARNSFSIVNFDVSQTFSTINTHKFGVGIDFATCHGTTARYTQGNHTATWVVRWAREHFKVRSEEHTSELQSREDLVCRLLLEI